MFRWNFLGISSCPLPPVTFLSPVEQRPWFTLRHRHAYRILPSEVGAPRICRHSTIPAAGRSLLKHSAPPHPRSYRPCPPRCDPSEGDTASLDTRPVALALGTACGGARQEDPSPSPGMPVPDAARPQRVHGAAGRPRPSRPAGRSAPGPGAAPPLGTAADRRPLPPGRTPGLPAPPPVPAGDFEGDEEGAAQHDGRAAQQLGPPRHQGGAGPQSRSRRVAGAAAHRHGPAEGGRAAGPGPLPLAHVSHRPPVRRAGPGGAAALPANPPPPRPPARAGAQPARRSGSCPRHREKWDGW